MNLNTKYFQEKPTANKTLAVKRDTIQKNYDQVLKITYASSENP